MTKEDLEQIGKLIDQKLEPIKHDMATKQDTQQLADQQSQLTEDMADFFHKTWDKMDETNERVTTIEDYLGLSRQTRN